MKPTLIYHVILTVDILKDGWGRINTYKKGLVKTRRFKVTEKQVEEPEYYKAHRKYTGLLHSLEELQRFISDYDFCSTCDTMGALGIGFGWMPAISFDIDGGYDVSINAYISPIFDDKTAAALDTVAENCRPAVQDQIDGLYGRIMPALKNFLDDPEELEEVIAAADFNLNQPLLPMIVEVSK